MPIILLATDTGFAYQPQGETSITGLNGLTLPISALTQTSRPTTPFGAGAGIQQTVTALNALGALVIGLGTNSVAGIDPRGDLSALAELTGAVNKTATTIPNGTTTPIAPGDPFYFEISSGFGASVANGVVDAIEGAATSVAVNVALKASDPTVKMDSAPEVVENVGAGGTASFDVTFEGDGRPHRFDLEFVRQGTNVVLGSIPVVIGTPIAGDGYEYEDLHEGQIETDTDFGDSEDPTAPLNVAPTYTAGGDQTADQDSGKHSVSGWATSISAGPASESPQLVDFVVSDNNSALFSAQPTIAPDGTLSYTPAPGASGTSTVSVALQDSGGTVNGGQNTSATSTFVITINPGTLSVAGAFNYLTGPALTLDFSKDVGGVAPSMIQLIDLDTDAAMSVPAPSYDPMSHTATVSFGAAGLPDGNYRVSIPPGAIPGMSSPFQQDFFVLAGDANRDQQVDTADFVALAAHFNENAPTFADGDFNYDGKVNALDFNLLATKFGSALTPPPPATTSALAIPAAASIASLFSNASITSPTKDLLGAPPAVL